jgi:hypothetical protein
MLQMKSDLLKVNRLERLAAAWVLANAKTGTWVALDANGVGQPALGGPAFPIFTESNRDGTVGFTGDVSVTKNVTILYGKFEARTDQFTGTPALNDKLYVLTNGTLANATGASLVVDPTALSGTPTVTELGTLAEAQAAAAAAVPVAICTKAAANVEWFGNTISVIEYMTI